MKAVEIRGETFEELQEIADPAGSEWTYCEVRRPGETKTYAVKRRYGPVYSNLIPMPWKFFPTR